MGYHIYTAFDLDDFIDSFGADFFPNDIFAPPPRIVVQNRNLGEWLRLRIASHLGISAGLRFLLPEEALREEIESFAPEAAQKLLYGDTAALLLYNIIEEMADTPSPPPDFHPISKIMQGEGGRVRLYDFSRSIIRLFNGYDRNNAPFIPYWDEEDSVIKEEGDDNLSAIMGWQKHLWQALYKEHKVARSASILKMIMDEKRKPSASNGAMYFIGSPFLGEMPLRFFYYTSQFYPVINLLFTPIPLDVSSIPPPLSFWNYPAQVVSRFIEEKGLPINAIARKEINNNTLLANIQRRIRHGGGEPATKESVLPDHSFQVISAPNLWREVEILKDSLLNFMEEIPDIKLNEIAIFAPNINAYSPFIEALFSEYPPLPCNFIDLSAGNESPYLKCFLQLIELSGGRFTKKEITSLVKNPCFALSADITDNEREMWLKICEDLAIRWGMDLHHRRKLLGTKTHDINTWKHAERRYLLGMILGEDDHPGFPYALPDESSSRLTGRLFETVEELYNDFGNLSERNYTLYEWCAFAEEWVSKYLTIRDQSPRDHEDRTAIKRTLRDIQNSVDPLADLGHDNKRYSFALFRRLLKEPLESENRRKGRYLTQGICCSSLRPFRAVPFRASFFLGMNADAFPGRDKSLGYDLKERAYSLSEPTPTDVDRFAFLELLTSVKERIAFFHTGNDPISGEALHPSELISALLHVLDTWFSFPDGKKATEILIQRHPLYSFDESYFKKDSSLATYNRKAWKTAVLRKNNGVYSPISSWQLPESPKIKSLPFKELNQFLFSPVRYYFRKSLGVSFGEWERDDEMSVENLELEKKSRRKYFLETVLNPAERIKVREHFESEARRRGEIAQGEISDFDLDILAEEERLLLRELNKKLDVERLPEKEDILFIPTPQSYPPIIPGKRVCDPLIINHEQGSICLHGEIPDIYFPDPRGGLLLRYVSSLTVAQKMETTLTALLLLAGMKESLRFVRCLIVGAGFVNERLVTSSIEEDRESLVVPKPEEVIEEFLTLYKANLINPIPYSSSLIGKLLSIFKKEIPEEDSVIAAKAGVVYEEILNDSYNPSEITSSRYWEKAYPENPDFTDSNFISLFRLVARLSV